MKSTTLFTSFFSNPKAYSYLYKSCLLAVEEDGIDMTANAIFPAEAHGTARIVAKSPMVLAGIDFIPVIFQAMEELGYGIAQACDIDIRYHDTSQVHNEDLAYITGPLRMLFKAERVILNYIIHCSGIATLTNAYVQALHGTNITVLDTRKTMPALRYSDKYSVLAGGGKNHRMDLEEMIMIRDVYTDYSGSITQAMERVRNTYGDICPPIALECRNVDEVAQAIELNPQRIMLDNMSNEMLVQALSIIPETIETEITGGITLHSIHSLLTLPIYPQYISIGAITHSAPSVDCSMYIMI